MDKLVVLGSRMLNSESTVATYVFASRQTSASPFRATFVARFGSHRISSPQGAPCCPGPSHCLVRGRTSSTSGNSRTPAKRPGGLRPLAIAWHRQMQPLFKLAKPVIFSAVDKASQVQFYCQSRFVQSLLPQGDDRYTDIPSFRCETPGFQKRL